MLCLMQVKQCSQNTSKASLTWAFQVSLRNQCPFQRCESSAKRKIEQLSFKTFRNSECGFRASRPGRDLTSSVVCSALAILQPRIMHIQTDNLVLYQPSLGANLAITGLSYFSFLPIQRCSIQHGVMDTALALSYKVQGSYLAKPSPLSSYEVKSCFQHIRLGFFTWLVILMSLRSWLVYCCTPLLCT